MEQRDSMLAEPAHTNGKIASQDLDLGADRDTHVRPCGQRTADHGWCLREQDHDAELVCDGVAGPEPKPRPEPTPPKKQPPKGEPPEMPEIGSLWVDCAHPDRMFYVLAVDPLSKLGRNVVGIVGARGTSGDPYACSIEIFLAVWRRPS